MTVFIVDDSAPVRNRLADLLNDTEGVFVVGAVGTIEAAIEGIAITHPDFVILDVHFREGSGIEVLEEMVPIAPEIVFIVLSNAQEPSYREIYLAAGARYFLDKSMEFNRVAEIILASRRQCH